VVQAMSLFNQLLQRFPSLEFAALVKKYRAERAAKGVSCRTQLVAMLFCQLAHADYKFNEIGTRTYDAGDPEDFWLVAMA
jgi:hypothetical protein